MVSRDTARTVEAAGARWAERCREHPPLREEVAPLLRVVAGPMGGHDSEVYEVKGVAGDLAGRAMILKLHRPARAAGVDRLAEWGRYAANEYGALSLLSSGFSARSPRLGVPRPIRHFAGSAALLTEKCAGERLDRLVRWTRLRPGSARRAALRAHFSGCGEWLGLLHAITRKDGSPAPLHAAIERRFDEDLETCARRGLPAALRESVHETFLREREAGFREDDRIVGRHCDFAPYNIFVSAERIEVVDLEGFQEGLPGEDLSYFLAWLRCMPSYHLSAGMAGSLEEAFLEGYRLHGPLRQEARALHDLLAMTGAMARTPVLRGGGGAWAKLRARNRRRLFRTWFAERTRAAARPRPRPSPGRRDPGTAERG